MTAQAGDHMSLRILESRGVLDGYTPPPGPFDPRGFWSHTYRVFTLAGDIGAFLGTLEVARGVEQSGEAPLQVVYDKTAGGGYRHRVTAELRVGSDALATPLQWSWTSEITGSGQLPGLSQAKTGRIEADKLVIADADGAHRREYGKPAAYTINWALFDAVQRLPRTPGAVIPFTLVDHFDQLKPNQWISFEKTSEVLIGTTPAQEARWEQLEKGWLRKTNWARKGGTVTTLHAFDHVGEGIVPGVYWVDDSGRLLFAVSGLEAYVLETS